MHEITKFKFIPRGLPRDKAMGGLPRGEGCNSLPLGKPAVHTPGAVKNLIQKEIDIVAGGLGVLEWGMVAYIATGSVLVNFVCSHLHAGANERSLVWHVKTVLLSVGLGLMAGFAMYGMLVGEEKIRLNERKEIKSHKEILYFPEDSTYA